MRCSVSRGFPGDDGSLAAEFAKSRRGLQRLMPDAKESLARLEPSFKIGLLTNGAPDLQREKIAASGLALFFDAIAVWASMEPASRSRRSFTSSLNRLESTPEPL